MRRASARALRICMQPIRRLWILRHAEDSKDDARTASTVTRERTQNGTMRRAGRGVDLDHRAAGARAGDAQPDGAVGEHRSGPAVFWACDRTRVARMDVGRAAFDDQIRSEVASAHGRVAGRPQRPIERVDRRLRLIGHRGG